MKSLTIGQSTIGQSIEVISTTDSFDNKKILLMSGLHGDEIEGIILNNLLLNHFIKNNCDFMNQILFAPVMNPDGFLLSQRWNFRHVDLNRNWPTKDWSSEITNPRYPPGPSAESEVETKVLRKFILDSNIEYVIDLHSYKDSVLLPLFHQEPDLLKTSLVSLSRELNIPIEYEQENLGYTIAGGLHTWCFENQIQNLTVEVEKGMGQFLIKERYLEPMASFIRRIS